MNWFAWHVFLIVAAAAAAAHAVFVFGYLMGLKASNRRYQKMLRVKFEEFSISGEVEPKAKSISSRPP